MKERSEGGGRRGEPTPAQAGQPEQKQTPQQRGEGIRGIPPPSEQSQPQQERGERQPLPSVWNVLEREVRLDEKYKEDRLTRQYKSVFDLYASQEYEEYKRERAEVNRLKSEQYEKGTARAMLILDLYRTVTLEPSGLPVLIPYNRSLLREEFQQFRSKVEPLSEKEIAEEIVKAKEDFERREKAHHRNPDNPYPLALP